METKSSNSYLNMGMGCLLYIALYAGIAYGLYEWMAQRTASDAGQWVAFVAAVFFTLAAGTLWELLKRLFTGKDPRAEILARAESGELPEADGPIVAAGKVRATAGVLKAPLSGVDCVAYLYRMYYETNAYYEGRRRRETVPVYWGYACRPFTVDTKLRALRILAPPQMDDPAVRHATPEDVARARHYIAATAFDEKIGLLDGLGSAFAIVNALSTDDDGEYRKDWKLAGATRGPESLLLEETVLAVGDTISLSGTWSAARGAVVPAVGAHLTVTKSPGNPVGADKLPVGNGGTIIWLLATAAIGAGIVWAATLL